MKKRCIAVILLWVLITCFGLRVRSIAYGDPGLLTAQQVGAAALSVGSSLGIDWSMVGAGQGFAGNWIGTEVQNYDNGESLIAAVSESIAIDAAGKLAIGQVGYNKICEFIDWLRQKYTINNQVIGTNNIVFDPQNIAGSLNGWAPFPGGSINASNFYMEGWSKDGALPPYASTSASAFNYVGLRVNYLSSEAYAYYDYVNKDTGAPKATLFKKSYSSMGVTSIQKQEFDYPEEYALPTVLNPDKEWTGTIGQHSVPDTNLGDLLNGALEDVEGGNLNVGGEIIDVPVPPGPVPTWIPIDDVIDGINQQGEILEGLGQDIGDIAGSIGDIKQGVADQTEAIENATEAVEGATEAVEELTETVTDALDVPEASEISTRKFDLSTLFPFCIPFDIYRMLQAFDGTPEAPHVQLPFVIQSIGFSYTFDLDFSAFDSVAAIMRTVEFIAFGIFLAFSTSKVIRW